MITRVLRSIILTSQAAGFALFLLLVPGSAVAQAPPGEIAGEPAFSDVVEVELAEVDLFVTDRDGQPVPGLTREDFQVSEDGQPVEITNLNSTDLPLVLAVFFDETNLDGPSRAAVVKSLRSLFADHLRPGDRVLLTSADGSLKLLQEPTGDPTALSAALDGLAAGAPRATTSSRKSF
jgi:VWFA-related protein